MSEEEREKEDVKEKEERDESLSSIMRKEPSVML